MSPPRVLIFSHEFPPYLGGVGIVGAQLAQFLVIEGFDVHVLTRSQAGRQSIKGVTFHDIAIMPKLWFRSYKRALDKLDLASFDSIILNEAAPTIVAGKYFDDAVLAKCTVLLHGLEVENLYRANFINLPRRLFGFTRAHRRATQEARNVIAVGTDMRDKFRAETGFTGIEVINMGANDSVFMPKPSTYRESRDMKDDDFLLVSGGRVVEEKGFPEMLSAFAELAAMEPNAYWIICGDGDYLPTLRREVQAMRLDARVMFEGSCTQQRLCEIYNACDAYWLISRYREALPLSYIEAQLTGLPTAGRNLGGTIEAISPGKTGWLVDDANACIEVFRAYAQHRTFDRDTVAAMAAPWKMSTTLRPFAALLREQSS